VRRKALRITSVTKIILLCTIVLIVASIIFPITSSGITHEATGHQNEESEHNILSETTQSELIITIQTDKTSYIRGENVTILGTVKNSNNDPIEGATVSIEAKDPNNNTIFLDIVFSLPNGTYRDGFRLDEDSILGEYHVYATASAAGYPPAMNQTTFAVELPGFHNIAITEISYTPKNPVVNKTATISVTVENLGNLTETCDVSVNYTLLIDPLIGTQTVTLVPGQSVTLNFTWTPNATGRYETKAYTSEIPDDINPSDNTKITYLYVSATYTAAFSAE
jgi:predicted nucleic acid-binding protein